jgi:hypothetical protein
MSPPIMRQNLRLIASPSPVPPYLRVNDPSTCVNGWNRDMALVSGTLQLQVPGEPRGQRLPIDFFFRSLAQDQGERAICIVLSGTGSDGTHGVRAIKGGGGMAMAQNTESTPPQRCLSVGRRRSGPPHRTRSVWLLQSIGVVASNRLRSARPENQARVGACARVLFPSRPR